ncbi:putative RNA-directed DNA polymerase [Arabidopsis thaliana]
MRDTQTDKAIYLLLYVGDMLIASGNMAVIREFKNKLNCEFEMKDLGKASRILGMDIIRDKDKGELILSQGNYLEKVLKMFGMLEARPVITPTAAHFKLRSLLEEEKKTEAIHMERIPYASVVGSLMYVMVGARPDLAFVVGFISRFISSLGKEHWSPVKWVLRY